MLKCTWPLALAVALAPFAATAAAAPAGRPEMLIANPPRVPA